MSDDLSPIVQTSQKLTLGDRIRGIASQLRQESDVQIKATSRILGAAAQIAQNHDRLIDEVVEMVQEDLDQSPHTQLPEPYTVEKLKQQFKTLKDAKAHFGIKASSWENLASKLNEQPTTSGSTTRSATQRSQDPTLQRLETIEQEIRAMRSDIGQIHNLLSLILENLS